MSTTIEQLEIQVQSNSTSAVKGIDALSASLSKLKMATKGGVGLTSVANQVRNLDTALKSMDSTSADKIDKLSSSLEKLKNLGSIKISSSIGNQLKNIGQAASSLTGVDFSGISKLSQALQPLNSLGKASGLQSAITQLQKLPQLAQTLNGINWGTFTSQIQQLTSSLAPLMNQLNSVSTAFSRLPSNISRVVTATNRVPAANNKAATSYVNLWAKLTMAINAVKTGARVLASWITLSNQYIENINLFTASMGQYAEAAQEYAEQVGEIMGIDPSEWMRNQGIFNTVLEGFGVVSDQAYLMSKNLTQLGYDLSSFFNISFEDAMQKLQSGISGELEPLRRLGYDLSVARLQQESLNLGIEKSVSNMTQAEKSQLRYYAIMTQVTTAQGDMARTLNAPANQIRVLQAQVTQCARALGNMFIPALNAVLPYAIALTKVIRMLANTVASFFGFELPDVDYSNISAGASAVGDLADGASSAGDGLGKAAKAAEKLKNATLGIDELNVLSKDTGSTSTGSGSGGTSGVGSGLDIDLPDYDFLSGLVESRVDEIVDMISGALSEITAVASTFALAIGTILVVTGANIPVGLGLMAIGAAGLVTTIAENWNTMSDRLAKTLTTVMGTLAGFFFAIGAFLAFSGVNVPLGAALMVAGAASFATAVTINWKFLKGDLSNALSILTTVVSGASLAIGALFALTGVNVPLGIGLIVAGAVGLATAVSLNWDALSDSMRKAIGILMTIVSSASLAFGAILAFTGVNMPVGVALIAAGAIGLVSAVTLNWGALTEDLKSSISTIIAIVSGALIGIGAILALTGVATALGIAMIAAGAVGIVATAGLNWNSLTSKIKNVLKEIGIAVGAALIAVGAILALTGVALPLGVALIAAGAVSLVSGVALNWDSITSKIKEVLKKIGVIAGAAMLAIGVILCLTGVGIPLGVALIAAGAASLVSGVALNWNTIQTKVQEGLNKISEKFGEFKEKVGEKLEGAKEKIQTWAGNVKEWFAKGKDGKGVVEHFKDLAKDIVDGFKNGINDRYETCKKKITTWASKVSSWFKEKLGIHSPSTVFYGYGVDTTAGFRNAISEKYGSSKSGISSWAESVKNWFSEKVNKISFSEFANNAIEGFKTKINTSYTNARNSVTTWASKTKEWFTNNSYGGVNTNSFGGYASNIIEGFRTKIGSTYTSVKSNITTWASKTKEWFTNSSFGGVNSTSFSGFAANVLNGFSTKIGNSYTTTKSNITAWASDTNSWFSNIASKSAFARFATNVVDGFKNKIGSYYTNAKSNMRTFGSNVKSWFTDYCSSSSFYNIASDVVRGFKKGIGALYSTCKNTILSWGSSIITWFKNTLDINSPSRVFYDMGAFTVEGFDNAIKTEGSSTKGVMTKWFSSFSGISPSVTFPSITAPKLPTARMALAVDTSSLSYCDPCYYEGSIDTEVSRKYGFTVDGFEDGLEKFYRDHIESTFNRMADDMRRQADKKEQTIVQVGNRTINDAVTTQKNANGYSFTE